MRNFILLFLIFVLLTLPACGKMEVTAEVTHINEASNLITARYISGALYFNTAHLSKDFNVQGHPEWEVIRCVFPSKNPDKPLRYVIKYFDENPPKLGEMLILIEK